MNSISIITACKSTESTLYIDELLESVRVQGEVLCSCEWVWVINGEDANSLARYIKEHAGTFIELRILTREHPMTPGAARKLAVEHASGDFICIQDSDDLMLSGRLRLQLNMMRETKVDVLYTKLVLFSSIDDLEDSSLWINKKYLKRIGPSRLALHCAPRNPSAFIRRSVFSNSSYHLELKSSEDYWLWCNVLLNGGSIMESGEPLVAYRVDQNFFHRRRGYETFRNDVIVKTYFLTRWLKVHRYVGLLFAILSSSYRLLGYKVFLYLYRFTHHER